MSYHHISTYERGKIEELNKLGFTSREIGAKIGRHHSSVARELGRFKQNEPYDARQAQFDYTVKRKNSKPYGKWNAALSEQIKERLLETWSPEQIAHTAALGKISFKSIYNWLYAGKIDGVSLSNLRRKGKKRSCRNLAFFARGTSIRKRPKEVYNREMFGHWELDTVVSGKEKSGCLATFIERKTRFYVAIKMPDKTADSMESAIKCLYRQLPEKAFLTATTDRGGEFACFDAIQKDLGVTLYFADPFCPHQRGSNEYGNGLLREFFPKKSDFGKLSQQHLIHSLALINNRPRKCLHWISPVQAFLHHLSHLT